MPLSGLFSAADVLKPSAAALGTPLSNGCEKKIPYPPRTTVLSDPKAFHANPKRGAKLFPSLLYGVEEKPLNPMNFTTPGVPETGLIRFGAKLFMRLRESTIGVSISQRKPRLR